MASNTKENRKVYDTLNGRLYCLIVNACTRTCSVTKRKIRQSCATHVILQRDLLHYSCIISKLSLARSHKKVARCYHAVCASNCLVINPMHKWVISTVVIMSAHRKLELREKVHFTASWVVFFSDLFRYKRGFSRYRKFYNGV